MSRPIDAGKTGFRMTGQDLFGRYARIAYGHAMNGKQDYHIYKCIQNFKSNCYCDTPLTYQTENNCYNHEDVTDVVNVIHCGIDESCVIRVALKDIELLPPLSPDDVRGVGCPVCQCKEPLPEDGMSHEYYIRGKTLYHYDTHFGWEGTDINYCPNCGAKMEVSDE